MKLQYMDLHAKAQAACSHFIQKMYRPCPDVSTGFCGLHCVRHLMQIRIATPKDECHIVALAVSFRNHLEREEPSEAKLTESVRTLLSSQDAEFFVVSTELSIVGYTLQRYRHSMWTSGLEATIEDLFVNPVARKRGFGRNLIEFALARAIHLGCTSVCLDTNEFNVASTKIYTDLGFESFSKRWNGRQVFFRKSLLNSQDA